MKAFTADTMIAAEKWKSAVFSLRAPRIFDYTQLKKPGEFEYQKQVIRNYKQQTEVYAIYYSSTVSRLKKKLSVLGEHSAYINEAIQGAEAKFEQVNPVFDPLMQMHINRANTMLDLMDFLQKNSEIWAYENGQLLFYDDAPLIEFNKLLEQLQKTESAITELETRLIQVL